MKRLAGLRQNPTARAIFLLLFISALAAVVVGWFEAESNDQFHSFWDTAWWVMVTISTVGYGDKVPVTPVGRVLAVFIMLFGMATLSVITATISSIFITRKLREGKGLQEIKLRDHILLCGWNSQAEQILSTFETSGEVSPVVLINQLSEEEVTDILSRFNKLNMRYVRGDFSRENILNRANVKLARSAIILPDLSASSITPGDERTILATLSIKTLNPKIKVYAHIINRDNLSHLKKARADEVIISDAYTGYLLASYVVSPGVPQFVDQLFSGKGSHALQRRPVPEALVGRQYSDLVRFYHETHNGVLIGLGQLTEPFNITDLMSDDYSYLDEFIMRKFQEAGRGLNSEEQVKILIAPPEETTLNKNDFFISLESES